MQWKGLTLEEPPSWSWLTSTPGKYALFESELSSCPNHQGFSRWETLLYVFNHDFEYELGCRCKQIVSHIAKNGENFLPGENKRGKTFDSCCTLWSVKCNIKCDSSVISALFSGRLLDDLAGSWSLIGSSWLGVFSDCRTERLGDISKTNIATPAESMKVGKIQNTFAAIEKTQFSLPRSGY